MRETAIDLVNELSRRGLRVVFAESCTGGLVASELAKIPGVSQWLCGSAVTYRCDTKVNWLGVREDSLAAHSAVSRAVTDQMAVGVLERTPEASLAAAVTGHLGPDAPASFDGVVFTTIAVRHDRVMEVIPGMKHQLKTQDREARQLEAAMLVFQRLLEYLKAQ